MSRQETASPYNGCKHKYPTNNALHSRPSTSKLQSKIRKAEYAWNTRDPQKVSFAYSAESRWRNRTEFINGREEILVLLTPKWPCELDYRLCKELWSFREDRMAVRFVYESRDASGQWFRFFGNDLWQFNPDGLMTSRHVSINNLPIAESERHFRWSQGRCPDEHPGVSEMEM